MLTRRKLGRAGNVSVEFALISVFLLFPLFSGGVDAVLVINAQAQLNTALLALYDYAWTNPTAANNTAYLADIITQIDTASTVHINFPTTTTTGTTNALVSYGCFTPPSTVITYQATTCTSSQTQQTRVTYQVTTTVGLPIPIPGIGSSLTLTAGGSVQTQ